MSTSATALLRAIFVCLLLLPAGLMPAAAQSRLHLSSEADFATEARLFAADDTLFLKAVVDNVDVTAVTENSFEIEPMGGGASIEGTFENNLDGTFTAAVDLSTLSGDARIWVVDVKIEDDDDAEFEARARFALRHDGDEAHSFVIRGKVEAASDTEVSIAGRTLRITADTRINIEGRSEARPADLVGRQAVARVQQDGEAFVALTIYAEGDERERPAEITVRGNVEAVTATSITVQDLTFTVNANTRLEGEGGATITLADLLVGAPVRVDARLANDAWIATRIKRTERDDDDDDDDQDEQEISGTIGAVGDAHFEMSGLRFEVNGDTEFEGVAGLNEIEVGVFAEVQYTLDAAGNRLAVEVEVEARDDDDDDEIEAEGTITALTDNTIEVDGLTFTVTNDTRIAGKTDAALTFADLIVGMDVEVKGRRDGDRLLALRIKLEQEDADETELSVHGRVTARSSNTVTIGTTTFVVTENTRIEGKGDARLTLDDIEVGMYAKAELRQRADGTLVAVKIEVEDKFDGDDIKVNGRIEAVTATSITVGDLTFRLDAGTEILDVRGNLMLFSALLKGQVVRVEGHVENGVLVADEIHVRGNALHEGRFHGEVTAVGDASLSIEDATFRVSDRTVFHGAASLGDVRVGQEARVHYRLLADGSRLALRVHIKARSDENVEISGTIDAIRSNTIVVADVAIEVTSETHIRGENDAALTMNDLEVGQHVEVTAQATADGRLQATRIEVEDAVEITAAIDASSESSIELAGQVVTFTDDTFIVSETGAELSAEALRAGVVVEVFAVAKASASSGKVAADQLKASRITVRNETVPTAVEPTPDETLPEAFTLEQNYPNPFNPETTIAFTLETANTQVSLAVYDALGRHVRTLVSGTLPAGQHRVAWNGRDGAGEPLASGIYLYRLRVGDLVQTRTMTLLK